MRRGSADIAHLIRVDFISCFLQIASQGNYIFVAFQFSQFLRGECATKIKNYSQFAWTVPELLKRWPQNTIIFLVPMNIPEFAPSDFFFKLCFATRGRCNYFSQSWNFELKIFLDFHFMTKIGSTGQWIYFLPQKCVKMAKNWTSKILIMLRKRLKMTLNLTILARNY